MAAADGSTCAGSSPKTQAVSMHSVGLTRLPPASIEYLIASSSPTSRGSSVNLKPPRYPSKALRWDSHRKALRAPSTIRHLAEDPTLGAPQHAADERGRLVAGEALGAVDGLAAGHLGRHVF